MAIQIQSRSSVITKQDIRRRLQKYSPRELKGIRKIVVVQKPGRWVRKQLGKKSWRVLATSYGPDNPARQGEIEIYMGNVRRVVGSNVQQQRNRVLNTTIPHEVAHHKLGHISRPAMKNKIAERRIERKDEEQVKRHLARIKRKESNPFFLNLD